MSVFVERPGRSRRSSGLTLGMTFGFSAIIFVLILARTLTSYNVRDLYGANGAATESAEVRAGLYQVLSNLVDADTQERRFIVTGDLRFLALYKRDTAAVQTQFGIIRTLISEPLQMVDLHALQNVAEAAIDESNSVIGQRRENGFTAAPHEMQGNVAAGSLDNVRRIIAAMDDREAARIRNQGLHAGRAYWLTMVTGFFGTAVELALVIALMVAAIRSGRDRARLQQIEAARLVALERERLARAEAERANRTKDDFLTTLSHELRTPLNAIVGWSNILKTADLPPERARYALEAILRGAEAETHLVDSLLDLSRISSGKMYLDKTQIDFIHIVNAAADTIRPSVASKHIQLEISTPTSPVRVMGDADRMQQVVWNLLSNAVKFTPEGGHISLDLRTDRRAVLLQISDNGRGIRGEFLPYIFDRFAQDGRPAGKHMGLGLGLAIVHALVLAHGGTIEVASAGDGQGSTFTVRFPLCEQTQPQTTGEIALTTEQFEAS